MGRSNREQADVNRQRIVDQADAAVRGGGVAAVSISDIMARVGMTQGGFYNHFESKDALIAEACASGFARSVLNWKARAHPKGRPVVGALKRLVAYYLARKPVEQGCPMVALGQDAARHHASPALHDAYREGVDKLFSTFKEIAHADPSLALSEDEMTAAFAAIVGASMLARATDDSQWSAGVEAFFESRSR
ncbi:UNVERIFIED_ORG: TetR family transcriptional regulator [Burkholderia sp. CF145]|uniref:TetR/AcrR family transcriptional regulator n=1 Tax=Paraburkholderia hospita TaxID=169430 RepID=UPI000271A4F4|nr:TetR/AcrR family transcriptional regulator [Paraburkholderia hospita]EUC12726.1 transcriptional regulator, TetR family [Burkholderia sp. BT03]SKD07807.1 transcriptional regulator, TetR family [Paraburkholderia hospita]